MLGSGLFLLFLLAIVSSYSYIFNYTTAVLAQNSNTQSEEATLATQVSGSNRRGEPQSPIRSMYEYRALKGEKIERKLDGQFKLSWPVADEKGVVTQCVDIDPELQLSWIGGHNGIDIADFSAPEIVAAADGEVVFSGCFHHCPPDGAERGGSGLARTVMIKHSNGFITVYGHLSQIYAEEGDIVRVGDSIGKMGQSGDVQVIDSAIHLHFTLLAKDDWSEILDPVDYLDVEREICDDRGDDLLKEEEKATLPEMDS